MNLIKVEYSLNLGPASGNALPHDIKHHLRSEVNIKQVLINKRKLNKLAKLKTSV